MVIYPQRGLKPVRNTAQKRCKRPKDMAFHCMKPMNLLLATHLAWAKVILWAQKLRETLLAAMGIFANEVLKSCQAQ